jgi:hypothetical protein
MKMVCVAFKSAPSAAAIVVATALVACGDTNQRSPDDSQRRSPRPAHDATERDPVVLAAVDLADGRRVTLRSSTDAAGPCLTVVGLDRYKRQCGRAPSERVPSRASAPIIADATAQLSPRDAREVYGATSADVAQAMLTYSSDGSVESEPASLMHITDSNALDSAGIREPFGYFIGELPPDATKISASALDSDGVELGAVDYEQFRALPPRVFIADAP